MHKILKYQIQSERNKVRAFCLCYIAIAIFCFIYAKITYNLINKSKLILTFCFSKIDLLKLFQYIYCVIFFEKSRFLILEKK